MKSILVLAAIAAGLGVVGCATPSRPRNASEYLLTTDKSSTALLRDLRTQLEKNKYKITREDTEAGILLVKPRRFSFNQDGKKISGQQTLQLRQEGGSLKVRVLYTCKYDDAFEACRADDEGLRAKIARIEPSLLELIRPVLMRHASATAPAPMPAAPAPAPAKKVEKAPAPTAAEDAPAPSSGGQPQTSEENPDEWFE